MLKTEEQNLGFTQLINETLNDVILDKNTLDIHTEFTNMLFELVAESIFSPRTFEFVEEQIFNRVPIREYFNELIINFQRNYYERYDDSAKYKITNLIDECLIGPSLAIEGAKNSPGSEFYLRSEEHSIKNCNWYDFFLFFFLYKHRFLNVIPEIYAKIIKDPI